MGHPVFVSEIRSKTNEVVIGENKDIFRHTLYAENLNKMAEKAGEGRIRCVFQEAQRAVTPGQAVVFYDGDYVLGGGTIIGAGEY